MLSNDMCTEFNIYNIAFEKWADKNRAFTLRLINPPAQ